MNLCDSDWIIDLLKGRDAAERMIRPMMNDGGIALSVISVGEIYQGIIYGKDPDWNEL
jgi:predicted nucleic acid-binding protein